jgi:hypothetical protein
MSMKRRKQCLHVRRPWTSGPDNEIAPPKRAVALLHRQHHRLSCQARNLVSIAGHRQTLRNGERSENKKSPAEAGLFKNDRLRA